MFAEAGAKCIAAELTQLATTLCADKVPNVRFNAAWAAGALGAASLCDTAALKAALTVRASCLACLAALGSLGWGGSREPPVFYGLTHVCLCVCVLAPHRPWPMTRMSMRSSPARKLWRTSEHAHACPSVGWVV